MSKLHPSASPGKRPDFVETFLREKNIQWILSAGVLILLASAAMLVTSHWEDFSADGRRALFLFGTGCAEIVATFVGRRLGLKKTARGLHILALILFPLFFLASPWTEESTLFGGVLLVLAFGGAVRSGVGCCRWLFGGAHVPLVSAYLVFCGAGAILHWIPGPPLFRLLGLWVVLLFGSAKVNRHAFWRSESGLRTPGQGLFALGLLGAQFLGLCVLHLVSDLRWSEVGFGLVLLAVPLLLAAEAQAQIFRQRTGDLVRPYPPAMILPTLGGLVLAMTGICLTSWDLFAGNSPVFITPSSALFAGVSAWLAVRTRRGGVLAASCGAALIAYQFSPALALECFGTLQEAGAAAVGESKLPLAFYGLSYVPLFAGFLGVWALLRKGDDPEIVRALRPFVIVPGLVLLGGALSHPKALLPVGLAFFGLFGLASWRFRDGALARLAHGSFLVAAVGAPISWQLVFGERISMAASSWSLVLASALLLAWTRRNPAANQTAGPSWLNSVSRVSLWGAFGGVALWLVQFHLFASGNSPSGLLLGVGLVLLFALHAIVLDRVHLVILAGLVSYVFGGVTGFAFEEGGQGLSFFFLAVLAFHLLTGIWFQLWPEISVSRVLRRPQTRWLNVVGVAALLFQELSSFELLELPGSKPSGLFQVGTALLGLAAAFGIRGRLLAGLAWFSLLRLGAVGFDDFSGGLVPERWIPAMATWVLFALFGFGIWLRRRSGFAGRPTIQAGLEVLHKSLQVVAVVVLSLFVFLSVVFVSGPLLIGGLCGTAVLFFLVQCGDAELLQRIRRFGGLSLGFISSLQVVLVPLTFFVEEPTVLFQLLGSSSTALPAAWLQFGGAVSLAIGVLLEDRGVPARDRGGLRSSVHRAAFVGLLLLGYGFSFDRGSGGFGVVLLIVGGWTFLAGILGRRAILRQSESPFWLGEISIGMALLYSLLEGPYRLPLGPSLSVLAAASWGIWILGQLARRGERTRILGRPLEITAMVLPSPVILFGLSDVLSGAPLFGWTTLSLFAVSAFSFYLGRVRDRRAYLVSLMVFNAVLLGSFFERQWKDPQIFLLPLGSSVLLLSFLFRKELPVPDRRRCEAIGALTILISPVFNVLSGSWLHLFSLMVLSVLVLLAGIGFRIRTLALAGTGFLIADLVSIVVRGVVDHPHLLWFAGVTFGALVVALGAFAERHREVLLQRLRELSATLQSWEDDRFASAALSPNHPSDSKEESR